MPPPLSLDLRHKIVQAVGRGCSIREAARRYDVAPSTAIKLMQRVKASGSAAPDRYGGHRRPLLEPFESLLEALVLATPDITLAELQRKIEQRVGIRAGLSTLHNALHRQASGIKKVLESGSSRIGPTSPPSAGGGVVGRPSWTRRASSFLTRPDHDRQGATLRAQCRGRAPGRCRPAGALEDHDLRRRAAGDRRIAPLVLDGPMTGPAFRAYVEQFLAPALQPGDVVVLDNLAAHKIDGVHQAITRAGAFLLYLPPYSPDLNPIEQLFAKLKALLRKAAARTRDELWSTIGRLIAAVPPAECVNYLAHTGYGSGSI